MKKIVVMLLCIVSVFVLGSCKEKEAEVPVKSNELEGATYVSQGGPFGQLTVAVPKGWEYELCPVDSENLISGSYGIHVFPEDVTEGGIEIVYDERFGVCGTGLVYERANLAGIDVKIGTYDSHKYWSHIAFDGALDNVVAKTYGCDGWWDKEDNLSLAIVDSIKFDTNKKEGAVGVYRGDSYVEELELLLEATNITNKGATIIYDLQSERVYGEVFYGQDYVLEKKENDEWKEVPVIVQGNYGFESIAYIISADEKSEQVLDWEWLYGKLSSGEYRIKKEICGKNTESGNVNQYEAYVYFVLS